MGKVIRVDEISPGEISLIVHKLNYSPLNYFIPLFVQEAMESNGELYVAYSKDKTPESLFVYDPVEKSGTCFTNDRNTALKFYHLKPDSEFFTSFPCISSCTYETLFSIDIGMVRNDLVLKQQIQIFDEMKRGDLIRFMLNAYGKVNINWVNSALQHGEKCFICIKESKIVGMGWLGIFEGIGRLHSLYVQENYRNMRIGESLVTARIQWARFVRLRKVVSEIPEKSTYSREIAIKFGFADVGKIYRWFHP